MTDEKFTIHVLRHMAMIMLEALVSLEAGNDDLGIIKGFKREYKGKGELSKIKVTHTDNGVIYNRQN